MYLGVPFVAEWSGTRAAYGSHISQQQKVINFFFIVDCALLIKIAD